MDRIQKCIKISAKLLTINTIRSNLIHIRIKLETDAKAILKNRMNMMHYMARDAEKRAQIRRRSCNLRKAYAGRLQLKMQSALKLNANMNTALR